MAQLHHEQPNVYLVIIGPELDPTYSAAVRVAVAEWPHVRLVDAVPQVRNSC